MKKEIVSKCCGSETFKVRGVCGGFGDHCKKCHKECEVIEEPIPQPIQKEEEEKEEKLKEALTPVIKKTKKYRLLKMATR